MLLLLKAGFVAAGAGLTLALARPEVPRSYDVIFGAVAAVLVLVIRWIKRTGNKTPRATEPLGGDWKRSIYTPKAFRRDR